MSRRAFTLIELLIVVAIIAILAAIAVPNFLEAQTRAKVSRFMSDLRSGAVALEAYVVDHNKYPPADAETLNEVLTTNPPSGAPEGYVPRRITTPVAYIASLPLDIFNHENPPHQPHYVNDHVNETLLAGLGPFDQYYVQHCSGSLKWQQDVSADNSKWDASVVWLAHSHGPDLDHDDYLGDAGRPLQYDPTNGTISDGDIFYFGPGSGFRK